ncbi:MAG: hypothetical protein HYX51_02010 [Chloroflexi bacterium]|nr:hypothetical protein [Chloroflexota bacterium]
MAGADRIRLSEVERVEVQPGRLAGLVDPSVIIHYRKWGLSWVQFATNRPQALIKVLRDRGLAVSDTDDPPSEHPTPSSD